MLLDLSLTASRCLPIALRYTPVQATAAALKAGTDRNCGGAFGGQLPKAYAAKLVSDADIDLAAGRGILGHMELGLFQDTAAAAKDERRKFPMSIVDSAPHRELAKQAAIQGVILLKNGAKALPLGGAGMAAVGESSVWRRRAAGSGGPIKVAVVGPNANRTLTLGSNYAGCKTGAGGPFMTSCTFVNPLQVIATAYGCNPSGEPLLQLYAKTWCCYGESLVLQSLWRTSSAEEDCSCKLCANKIAANKIAAVSCVLTRLQLTRLQLQLYANKIAANKIAAAAVC